MIHLPLDMLEEKVIMRINMRDVESDFEAYVERYCRKHKITPEEAKEHAMVREVKAYYEEDIQIGENNVNTITRLSTGCC